MNKYIKRKLNSFVNMSYRLRSGEQSVTGVSECKTGRRDGTSCETWATLNVCSDDQLQGFTLSTEEPAGHYKIEITQS